MGAAPTILICVGATKAGTTWLHDQLSAHAECYLRSIKEYHYFSTVAEAHWDKKINETQAEIDMLAARADLSAGAAARLADLRSYLPLLLPKAVDAAAFGAYLRDAPKGTKLVGDCTPAYSIMPGSQLKAIHEIGDNVKVVYLMRDPIARLWSHIRMSAGRAAPDRFQEECTQTLQRMLAGQEDGGIRGIVKRGDYAGNLPKLQRIFGQNLMAMFTEDLMTDAGFARLLGHLDLSPAQPDTSKRVHEGRAFALPSALRRAALQFLRPQYDYIASHFSALPQAWADSMADLNTSDPQKVLL